MKISERKKEFIGVRMKGFCFNCRAGVEVELIVK